MSRTGRRRRVRRWLRGRGRFYFSLLFTVLVSAYVAVPWVVQLVETVGGYSPADYEPKDIQREDYVQSVPASPDAFFGGQTLFKLVLLVLVGLVWLIAVPSATWRGRDESRR